MALAPETPNYEDLYMNYVLIDCGANLTNKVSLEISENSYRGSFIKDDLR